MKAKAPGVARSVTGLLLWGEWSDWDTVQADDIVFRFQVSRPTALKAMHLLQHAGVLQGAGRGHPSLVIRG